jgi:oligoendopeptidase F
MIDRRVVLVSGANRGIGAAIAREMIEAGWCVSLGARDPATLAVAHGDEAEGRLYAAFDAETPSTAADWVAATMARYFGVFIPFAAGVMSEFEKALYADQLPENEFNKKWWDLVKRYQGIVPPSDRGEMYCDAASKTHINNDAAQYYDYALSYVILFQLHQHIAEKILHQPATATNYYGEKKIGEFLHQIMSPGATRDWREVMKEATGEEMNAKAIVRYFEPLMSWLKEENKGRTYTLPEEL